MATATKAERAASNGTVETITVELEGRYAGWHAECDADPDWAFLDDLSEHLQGGHFGPAGKALLRVVLTWNFQAKDGTTPPVSDEGMRQVPARAILLLANGYISRWAALPNLPGGG